MVSPLTGESARLHTAFDGEVAWITLDRPPVNVIDFPMIAEMQAFLGGLHHEQHRKCVVIQANGRVFSGGVDIPAHLPETVDAMIREFHSILETLEELSVPTVALVRGAALGGACELVGCCDVVLATAAARFGLPEIKLGVYPPAAAAIFPRRYRYQDAMRMLFTGEQIDAAAAQRMGLVSEVVSDDGAASALEDLLRSLREKSAASLRITKLATLRARGATFRELVGPSEQVYLRQLMATSDAVEGLQAFVDKRPPVWSDA
ncbi:MAG: echA8 3 [Chloroflexi bacterium]|nr:echA8 3 [Chloroflexota bacterium]